MYHLCEPRLYKLARWKWVPPSLILALLAVPRHLAAFWSLQVEVILIYLDHRSWRLTLHAQSTISRILPTWMASWEQRIQTWKSIRFQQHRIIGPKHQQQLFKKSLLWLPVAVNHLPRIPKVETAHECLLEVSLPVSGELGQRAVLRDETEAHFFVLPNNCSLHDQRVLRYLKILSSDRYSLVWPSQLFTPFIFDLVKCIYDKNVLTACSIQSVCWVIVLNYSWL